jgi:hypothetical protein
MGTIITRSGKGQALTAQDHDANMEELFHHPDGMFLPKGKGIFVGPENDQTHGWRDLIGSVRVDLSGQGATVANYIGGIKQHQFAVGDEEVREFHMPHDYAVGTNLYIHAHWSHNSTSVTSGDVTWQFEAMSARGHDTDAFYTPVVVNVTQNASTERYRHMIAEVQLSEPGGVSMLDNYWIDVDGLIIVACRLTGNTMSGGATPFLHSFDIHYQSTNMATKNKVPDFNA